MECSTLHPIGRPVLLVEGDCWRWVLPGEATPELLGVKAAGLLRVPAAWVPFFFVVSGSFPISQPTISEAAAEAGVSGITVYVRSNGTAEGANERGALDSSTCALDKAAEAIEHMQASDVFRSEVGRQDIHFIVQSFLPSREKGHLSNERRLSRHPRDWHVEMEKGAIEPLGVRRWRDASSSKEAPLISDNRASIPRALRSVAAWASPCRAHLEWIWDGSHVWIVQLDFLLPNPDGVKPSSLVSKAPRLNFDPADLQCFSVASAEHFATYGKLKNARIYTELGYDMPSFFVMNRPEVVDLILQGEVVPESLRRDLEILCAFPFVIRTDATGFAGQNKQMLPRSDELRSADAAVSWLLGSFRTVMSELEGASNITLVGHHFLPAAASAWAQAQPDERRVRIESLWGIPEGTYYFAHDVYDIDTGVAKLEQGAMDGCREVSVRERFKGRFIAPNDSGEWIVQQTDQTSDWSRSVRKKTWLQEVAWTTRKIAVREGKPVVVMWFIDIPREQSRHEVMPWYHERWEPSASGYKKAAQRKKVWSAEFREITNRESWNNLKDDVANGVRIERVFINPADSEIVRDRQFVKELAGHALKHGYVVELGGGLLSHAFYMLSGEGCSVECVDLFGVQEENIEFNKLVRDLIPEGIRERGEQVEIVRATGDALIESLKRKVVEEVYEVVDAKSAGSIIEEIADVEEVIDGLLKALGVDRRELADVQSRKRRRRGGFDQGIMLVRTSLATPVADIPQLENTSPRLRSISRPEELPVTEQDFHVDRRVDISGISERQLTLTLPAQANSYTSGVHRFNLDNTDGTAHDIVFSAHVERFGAQLKLKVKLTNAAVQLDLPLDESEPK